MFRRLAVFTLARDASFVALAGGTLMVGFSFAPALAFAIGAHVALLFSLALLVRVARLSEQRVSRTEVWRGLQPDERPGRRSACDDLRDLLFHFAKSAAAIAVALQTLSLLASFVREIGSGHAVLAASAN
jgi:hypothetical protein